MVRGINPAYLDPYSKKLQDTANGLWVFLMPGLTKKCNDWSHAWYFFSSSFLCSLGVPTTDHLPSSYPLPCIFFWHINDLHVLLHYIHKPCLWSSFFFPPASMALPVTVPTFKTLLLYPPYYLPFSVAASKRANPHSSSFVFTQQHPKKSHSQWSACLIWQRFNTKCPVQRVHWLHGLLHGCFNND